jgi:anti-sigma factor ChrR (cupin superfamily)
MLSSLTCLEDPELLAVASGDSSSVEMRAHLAHCSSCRERLERLEAEVGLLRREAPRAMLADPARRGIISDPAPD